MGKRRRTLLMTALLFGSSLVPLSGPTAPREAEAAGCTSSVSCGFGCTARLVFGVCVPVVEYQGQIGEWIIWGPKINVLCEICECWYMFDNLAGNRQFLRKGEGGCSGSISIKMIRE